MRLQYVRQMRVDTKRLREEAPELYDEYAREIAWWELRPE